MKGKNIQWRVIFLVALFLGTMVALSLFTHFSLDHARNLAYKMVIREIDRDIRHEVEMSMGVIAQWLSDLIKNISEAEQKKMVNSPNLPLFKYKKIGFHGFIINKKGEIIAPKFDNAPPFPDKIWKDTSPILFAMISKSIPYRVYTKEAELTKSYYLFLTPVPGTSLFIYSIADRRKIFNTISKNLEGLKEYGQKIIFNIVLVNFFAFVIFLFASFFIIRQIARLEDTIYEKSRKLQKTNDLLEVEVNIRVQIENDLKEANRELKRLSVIDGLTGIANRRAFDNFLENEWNRNLRDEKFLTLLLCDVDYFKKYNDHYGHQAGDECLKKIASVLERQCHRPADFAARYGGEEFAIVLSDTDKNGTEKVGEEVRAAVESLDVPHEKSEAASVVTISIGAVVLIPGGEMEISDMIKYADLALYRAKEEGRNRLTFYQD